MEDVLDIDGSFFASDDGDELTTSAANIDTGVNHTLIDVHDEVEVNTERFSFKDEYAKSIRPITANVESLFARFVLSGLQFATHHFVCNDDEKKLLALIFRKTYFAEDYSLDWGSPTKD